MAGDDVNGGRAMRAGAKTRRLAPPAWSTALAVVAAAFLAVPVIALAVRVPWARLPELLATAEGSAAIWLSLRTSLLATLLVVVLGVPLALLIASAGRLRTVLRVIVVLPMTMPPVVGGLALLAAFSRTGLIGSRWEWLGEYLSFSTPAVVAAQVFVSMPFLVISLEGAIRGLDPRHAEAAAGLGASRSRILLRVTLPMVLPAVISGTTLSMARALGEFGATLTFAGSMPGITRTLPLAIYLGRESDTDLALALSAVLLGIAVVLVAISSLVPTAAGGRGQRGRGTTAAADDAVALPDPAAATDTATVTATAPAAPLDVTVRVPGLLDARITATAGDTTAVIGPNGAGKSTLLRAIAGLPTPSTAYVDPAPPRAVLLTQDPALFPHMSVLDNVRFACRDTGRARRELAAVGALGFARRRPSQLSGGQAARVALARALAADVDLILLDEPFAALDASSASRLRQVLRERLYDATVLLVTHDPVDVATLADRTVVIEDGKVAAEGSATRLLTRPTTPFLAAFSGLAALRGEVTEMVDDGLVALRGAGARIVGVADAGVAPGMTAVALFAPQSVVLSRAGAESSIRNRIACTVTSITRHGAGIRIGLHATGADTLKDVSDAAEVGAAGTAEANGTRDAVEDTATLAAEITADALAELRLEIGDRVTASVKAMQVTIVAV